MMRYFVGRYVTLYIVDVWVVVVLVYMELQKMSEDRQFGKVSARTTVALVNL